MSYGLQQTIAHKGELPACGAVHRDPQKVVIHTGF